MKDIKDKVIQGVICDSLTYVIIGRELDRYGQGISSKPIKGLLSLSCGTASDIAARTLAPYVEEYLGQRWF